MKKILIALSTLALAAFSPGCVMLVAGAAGAGAVAYIQGGLEATLEANMKNSIGAAKDAAENLELKLISDSSDALNGEILLRDSKDRKITIKFTKITKRLTSMEIRVGSFGDETMSRLILEEVQKEL